MSASQRQPLEADAELREAPTRYGSIRPEPAQRFAEAVVDTVGKIAGTPLHYAAGRRNPKHWQIR